jgi:hypothetical protein
MSATPGIIVPKHLLDLLGHGVGLGLVYRAIAMLLRHCQIRTWLSLCFLKEQPLGEFHQNQVSYGRNA